MSAQYLRQPAAHVAMRPDTASRPTGQQSPAGARSGIEHRAASRPLRVLVMIDEMEVGGAQQHIVRFLEHVDRRRVEPSLLYFRNPSFLVQRAMATGTEVLHVAKRRRIDPAFALALRRRMAAGRYDVVHGYSFTSELWGLLAHETLRHGAFVSSIRATYDWYAPWQWRIKAWVSRRSSAIVANSAAGARHAERMLGMPAGRIPVVHNGIVLPPLAAAEQLAAIRTALGLDAARTVGLFVGRLDPLKNVPSLLRALAQLPDAGEHFLIAGDGPLRGELEALARQLSLSGRVTFLGERPDAALLMQVADYLVLPSHSEGLSNTILEAMAHARPVVASDVGGNAELVDHGGTGVLYPAGDVAALAGAVGAMRGDVALRRAMGRAARDRVARDFTLDATTRRLEAIYERVARR